MFRRNNTALVRILVTFLGVLGFAHVSTRGAGQESALPAGRALVDKHVAAIGGASAVRLVQSVRARGTVEIPAQAISGTVEVLTARPDRTLVRAEIPGLGRIERGYDGKVGWSIDPVTGASLVTGQELTELIDESSFDDALHLPDRVKELTTIEQTTFDDRPAYKVKVVLHSGTEQFEYFDVETGMLIGTEGTREMPGGGSMPRVGTLRDYKRFGAIMHPTVIVEHLPVLGFEQIVRLQTVDYDVVPPDAFALPAEVKVLIGRN
jgi:hypothetical protein